MAARTDVGLARERNEDAYFVGDAVFAVADGLGGHQAGEVASRTALEPLAPLADSSPAVAAQGLADAIRSANRRVYERATADEALRGMGTTLTAVVVDGATATVAHVGDSRCYLLRGDAILQLTEDHTVVARMVREGRLTREEAESHPQRSLLLRALGSEDSVEVDETTIGLSAGDRLLLCSDGLTAVVADEEILEAASAPDLDAACDRLVAAANARGGPDNITVVLVEIAGSLGPTAKPGRPGARRRVPVRPVAWGLVVLTVALGGWLALRWFSGDSFYVGVDESEVVVFRGLPADVLRPFARVEERTGLSITDVADWYRPRLEEGIRAEDLSDARGIVELIPRTAGPGP